MPLEPESEFGAYRLIGRLGRGGFAEVWEAAHLVTGRRVALKILSEFRASSPESLLRFQQEAHLAAALFHARCVYVFEAGASGGVPFISMALMTGGTLADRARAGPMPPSVAVDYILDILDGLEAAQAAGILHRDLKPSNVFLDQEGRATIGDFGIAKSLTAPSGLSVTGSFIGTPQYASPEQAAGEALDFRSDLYATGTILYELLTGRPPFTGENHAQVLARVLMQPPAPYPADSPVPRGLRRVVAQFLAKSPADRFQSHQAARQALFRYSRRGQLLPATLPRRAAAIVFDLILLASTTIVAVGGDPRTAWLVRLLHWGYFTLGDGLLGGTFGKLVLGLRVRGEDDTTPSFGHVALRSLVFLGFLSSPAMVLPWILPDAAAIGGGVILLAAQMVSLAILLSPMRRGNGFAGLHELASRTRVVAARRADTRTRVPTHSPAFTPISDPGAFGPFRAVGQVWRESGSAFLVARDDELRRDVWIHCFREEDGAPPPAELQARGEGSLRWLQRGTTPEGTWDAYGAPDGIHLQLWAEQRDRPGWSATRTILLSLGRELSRRGARSDGTALLSPARCWVTAAGTGVLLDFAYAPGDHREDQPSDWADFLSRVARLALLGQPGGPVAGSGAPRLPLPLHARSILGRLNRSGSPFTGPAEFVAELEATGPRAAAIGRVRRAVGLILPALLAVLIVGMASSGVDALRRSPRWMRDLLTNRATYVTILERPPGGPEDDVTARTFEATQIVLAAAMLEARENRPASDQVLAAVPPSQRALLDSAVLRYPAPTPAEVDSARAWVDARVLAEARTRRPRMWMAVHMLGVFGLIATGMALLLRGPLLLHLFEIAVVRTDGQPAGRIRCAVRSAVGWSPLAVIPLGASTAPIVVQVVLAGIALVGAVASVVKPGRGPADRIAGTVLVPR